MDQLLFSSSSNLEKHGDVLSGEEIQCKLSEEENSIEERCLLSKDCADNLENVKECKSSEEEELAKDIKLESEIRLERNENAASSEHESGLSEGNISMQTKRIRRRRKFKKRHSKRGKPKYKKYFVKHKTRRRRRRYSNLEHYNKQ
jgi:hypothetical protein